MFMYVRRYKGLFVKQIVRCSNNGWLGNKQTDEPEPFCGVEANVWKGLLKGREYQSKQMDLRQSKPLLGKSNKKRVQSFRLIMAASAGHAVAYTIGPIFKHIIDCVQLYFTNGFTNIVL